MKSLQIADIFILICKELPINKIVNLKLLSQYHKTIIQNTEFIHSQLDVNTEQKIIYYIKEHKFYNLLISRLETKIITKYITELSKCHTVRLCNASIPNKYMQQLSKCHTIQISHNFNLKKETFKKLKHCHSLIIFDSSFHNKYLKYIQNIHKLAIVFITLKSKHVKYLQNIHTLELCNAYIPHESMPLLKNVKKLTITKY
jgi:hypothetical protein